MGLLSYGVLAHLGNVDPARIIPVQYVDASHARARRPRRLADFRSFEIREPSSHIQE